MRRYKRQLNREQMNENFEKKKKDENTEHGNLMYILHMHVYTFVAANDTIKEIMFEKCSTLKWVMWKQNNTMYTYTNFIRRSRRLKNSKEKR